MLMFAIGFGWFRERNLDSEKQADTGFRVVSSEQSERPGPVSSAVQRLPATCTTCHVGLFLRDVSPGDKHPHCRHQAESAKFGSRRGRKSASTFQLLL